MAFDNPFDRESRVAVSMMQGVGAHEACDGTYGDEDDDRSAEENAIAWENTDVDAIDREYIFPEKDE